MNVQNIIHFEKSQSKALFLFYSSIVEGKRDLCCLFNVTVLRSLKLETFILRRIQDYNKQMKQQQRRFTPQYNQAIIRLIKHKFQPLQRSKASNYMAHKHLLNSEVHKQAKSCHLNPQVSLPSLPSAPFHQILAQRSENEFTLLEKARNYVQKKRREHPNYEDRVQLRDYIALFERRIEMKERGKRESIEMNLMEYDTRHKLEPLAAIKTDYEQLQLNQEQRSIMNAKIRRKLNHRKIIDLAKRA